MNAATNIPRWRDRVLATVFCVAVSLPLALWLVHFRGRGIDEHRLLSAFPAFGSSAGNIQNYLAQLERYYDDHFGGREVLIATGLKIKRSLFAAGLEGKFISGKDGWLFYTSEQMAENQLGLCPLTHEELHAWQTLLEKRRDWLAARGIRYLFVVAPNKETIHADELPVWLRQPPVRPTVLDQLLTHLRLHSTVDVLDLRPVLNDARKAQPMYFKADTHWNQLGAFIAYQTVMTNLSRHDPGLTPVRREAFEISPESFPSSDLARLAGMPGLADDRQFTFRPGPQLPPLRFLSGTTEVDYHYWATVPLPEFIVVRVLNPEATGSAVFFGDSFSTAFVPFFGYHFGRTTFLSRDALDAATILQEKPLVVVSEMVERHLHTVKPAELMAFENLDAAAGP